MLNEQGNRRIYKNFIELLVDGHNNSFLKDTGLFQRMQDSSP
jgi:hypothetical protein